MACNFEKPPFFKLSREWDAKTKLPEVYKFVLGACWGTEELGWKGGSRL